MILAALEAFAEAPDGRYQVAAIGAEMRHQILREQKVGVEIGLEVGIGPIACAVDTILVTVDHRSIGVCVDFGRDFIKRRRGQQTIMIHQRNPLALGKGQRGVAGGTDVAIGRATRQPNARVACGRLGKHLGDVRRRRGIIGNAQLPMRPELRLDRSDRRAKEGLGRIVDRHHHGNQRPADQRRDMRGDRGAISARQALLGHDPFWIGVGYMLAHALEQWPQHRSDNRSEYRQHEATECRMPVRPAHDECDTFAGPASPGSADCRLKRQCSIPFRAAFYSARQCCWTGSIPTGCLA